MARTAARVTFDTVRDIGLALPDVEEGTAYGSPALKVRGKMFTCIAIHRTAEPDSLAIRLPVDQRDALIAEEPHTYYLTPHYEDYPVVLARLARLNRDALADLLRLSRNFVTAQTRVAARPRRRKRVR